MPNFRTFAIAAHGDQRYGEFPYAYHLASVEDVLDSLIRLHPVSASVEAYLRAATWLHDVVEDTPVPISTIHLIFGVEIGGLVWAVTGEGKNRKERFLNISKKILESSNPTLAALLKLADRIANVRQAALNSSGHLEMYGKEQSKFEALIRPLVQPAQWKMLSDMFN